MGDVIGLPCEVVNDFNRAADMPGEQNGSNREIFVVVDSHGIWELLKQIVTVQQEDELVACGNIQPGERQVGVGRFEYIAVVADLDD